MAATATSAFDWYFDFVSPYAYLQFAAHPALVADPAVVLKPVLFAGLLNHWGQKGPAEIAAKRVHTYRQALWLAQRHGVSMRFPPAHPFNPVGVLRLAIVAGASYPVVKTIFDFIWNEGRSVDREWAALCDRLGVADPTATGAPAVKERLRRNGREAIAAGVFGVPTFVAGDRLFWGLDATGMLVDHRRDPACFDTPEMRRVATLPAAAERRLG